MLEVSIISIIFINNIIACIPYGEAAFGEGSGSILLDEVVCKGDEREIADCNFIGTHHDCYHFEDAGVRCEARTGGKFFLASL